MLPILKLVRGAVSSKDLLPVLTHFCIYDGRIQGANGRVALDAACPDLKGHDAVVPAERFLKAVDACAGEPKLAVSDDGTKLRVSRKRFRAQVPLLGADAYPRENPPSQPSQPLPAPLLPVLKRLEPFVSSDASRPWSCSILLRQGYAYATNNVVLARCPFPWTGPDLMLSDSCVGELLRLEVEPQGITYNEHAFYALYGSFWLKAQLLEGAWPESLSSLLDKLSVAKLPKLPKDLLDAVTLLAPFFPDEKLPIVLTGADGVSTMDGLHSAAVEGFKLPPGAFRLESLSLVLAEATHADLEASPAVWRGPGIEGLLSGVRV